MKEPEQLEFQFDDIRLPEVANGSLCPKCKVGKMKYGFALASQPATCSEEGTCYPDSKAVAKVIEVLKCNNCGHSLR